MSGARRFFRFALAGVLTIGLLAAGSAHAHSKQEATFPADGAVLSVAPEVVMLHFDVPTRITMIRLSSESEGDFELERSDAMQPVTEFRAIPPPLPEGRYTVEWRGLSSDGHPQKGRFSFEVTQ